MNELNEALINKLKSMEQMELDAADVKSYGTLVRVRGLSLEAVGCYLPLGAHCTIASQLGEPVEAQVVGFFEDRLQLMLKQESSGIAPGAKVMPLNHLGGIQVGHEMLGRVLNANGIPIDDGPVLNLSSNYPLEPRPINPLSRQLISKPLDVGVRSINSFLTIGRGQRVGLMAGSGVGKSVLLGMMTRYTNADVVVVGLIGERGREVREFIADELGPEGMKRAVVVVSPADQSALMRLQGAYAATTIAEYFRDQGHSVLLLMDSLTRFAQAQREIGLSIGEPPTQKGYTPSVFSKLPQLIERAGSASLTGGEITGIYTVLSENDDQNDPIVDASRAILDGHFVLSRALAQEGHYPAISLEASISRVMPKITTEQHRKDAQCFRRLYSKYLQNQDLIMVGAYAPGMDLELDKAVKHYPKMREFLQQATNEFYSFDKSLKDLSQLIESINNE